MKGETIGQMILRCTLGAGFLSEKPAQRIYCTLSVPSCEFLYLVNMYPLVVVPLSINTKVSTTFPLPLS